MPTIICSKIIFLTVIFVKMQNKVNKPLVELSHLLMRNNLQPTPKRSSLIGQYPKQHKENLLNVNNISRSPARSMSRKTLASKEDSTHSQAHNDARSRTKSRKMDREALRTCQNHQNIEGNFHINIDGEDLFYCQKCAIKLKNQGFPIKRAIEGNYEDSHRRESQQRTLLPAYSHFEGHPQFDTLKSLLSEIYESESKMLGTQGKSIEELFMKAETEMDNFYDSIQEITRIRREACRTELRMLNQSFIQMSNPDLSQASEEIRCMKRDIEENVESIIDQVEEETFVQCVDNYKERLAALNRVTQQHAIEIEKLRQKLACTVDEEAACLQTELLKIQAQTVSCSSQKVLTSQVVEPSHLDEGQTRGPFRNLFHNEKQKPKKRLISRK